MNAITTHVYFPLVFKIYKPAHKAISKAYLEALPQNAVGKKLISFLKLNGIGFIEGYELHDVKHLLTGYGLTFEAEIELQYFEMGNGNYSLPVLLVVVVGTLLAPERLPSYIAAYKRGKNCPRITSDFLLQHLATDVNQLKQLLKL